MAESFPNRKRKEPSFAELFEAAAATASESVSKEKNKAETAEAPQTFSNIRFRPVLSREGELVAYKSSELGRKEITLDPAAQEALADFDTDEDYTVRVLFDTKPDDPGKGSYVVEIVRETLEHKAAQQARAERLRSSRGFKTLAQLVKEDPDLSVEYAAVVGRHKEYRALHTEEGARHRNFTGMLSGIMMSERGNALLDRVIDRTIEEESTAMKEYIGYEKPVYVPSVTIGAGVYGALLATTRQMFLPEVPDLTIEQSDRVGGQFAQYRSDLFRLNSRRRPEMADAAHLPGSKQSLNTFGKHSVMQSSDTGGESYPHQSTIADTARINFFLAGKAMVNTELRKVRKNVGAKEGEGELILECLDKDSGRIVEIATDRLTFSTGIGEEADRLDPFDSDTRAILREEKERYEQGEDAVVMSFTQFARRMSDPTDPFPLKGMKRLILSGEGDSANVIAGIALGYESQLGKTASQLDNVEEIVWVGEKFETKEEFLQNIRVRYAQIGLEFPRERFENYYHRIKPVSDRRSFSLERTPDGGVRVYLTRNTERRSRKPNPELQQRGFTNYVEGDHFIYAHGFVDRTDDVLASASNTVYSEVGDIEDEIDFIQEGPYSSRTAEIYYKEGPVRRLEVLKDSDEFSDLGVEYVMRDGTFKSERISVEEFRSREKLFQASNVERIERSRPREDIREDGDQTTEQVYAKVRGRNRPIAEQVTLRGSNAEIFKVGPAAALPLTPQDIREAPALGQITENTAAIFRYAELTEKLGERVARADVLRGVTRPELFDSRNTLETVLPEPRKSTSRSKFSARLTSPEKLPLTANSADLLRFAVGDTLSKYSFPESLDQIVLTFVPLGEGDTLDFEVQTKPALTKEYVEIIKALAQDDAVAGVLQRAIRTKRGSGIKITIPLSKGAVRASEVRYSLNRGS